MSRTRCGQDVWWRYSGTCSLAASAAEFEVRNTCQSNRHAPIPSRVPCVKWSALTNTHMKAVKYAHVFPLASDHIRCGTCADLYVTPPLPFRGIVPHRNAQSPKIQSPLTTVKSHPNALPSWPILPSAFSRPFLAQHQLIHSNKVESKLRKAAAQHETHSPFWARACAHSDSVRLASLRSFPSSSK